MVDDWFSASRLAVTSNGQRVKAESMGEPEQVRAALALQLNFLQHIFTILKQHGRGAIVVPIMSSSKAAPMNACAEAQFGTMGDKLA
jgi:hypothetical protein